MKGNTSRLHHRTRGWRWSRLAGGGATPPRNVGLLARVLSRPIALIVFFVVCFFFFVLLTTEFENMGQFDDGQISEGKSYYDAKDLKHYDLEVMTSLFTKLRRQGGAAWSVDFADKWQNFQRSTTAEIILSRSLPPTDQLDDSTRDRRREIDERKFKILVLIVVGNSVDMVERWKENLLLLTRNRAQDIFDFAFHHYDGDNSLWTEEEWYNTSPRIVKRDLKTGCKISHWKETPASAADHYDYVWLIDSDMDFRFFDWDLYRTLLFILNPLVSQPAIIPRKEKTRSSDISFLRMNVDSRDGRMVLAREEKAVEVMAPILSASLWRMFRQRIERHTSNSDYGADAFFSKVARLANGYCSRPLALAGIVVDASPLVHLDTRTMGPTPREKARQKHQEGHPSGNKCVRPCAGSNCDDFTDEDRGRVRATVESLYGPCDSSLEEGSKYPDDLFTVLGGMKLQSFTSGIRCQNIDGDDDPKPDSCAQSWPLWYRGDGKTRTPQLRSRR